MKRYAVHICGGDGRLVSEKCPKGGPDHDPMPTGYGDFFEYADQLMADGWTQTQCPVCDRWAFWVPPMPMPMPPMRFVYDDPEFVSVLGDAA